MDKLEAFRNIAAQAGRGELAFPTNVNASLKIQQVINDPDCHLETAAKLIATEPLLAARTVAIANSVAYNRSRTEITNVRTAVMRLGFRTLQSLVSALIVRQFGSKIADPALRAKAAQLWEHTAHVAALSQVIARHVTHIDPETAMFAGIVHEVGGNEDWAEYGERIIGRAVLKKLAVPEEVVTAVVALGYRELPPKTLGDTLLLANDLAPIPSPLHQVSGFTKEQATSTIDFEIGEETLNSILEESAEEVRSLTAALLN